jgi:lysophospholipase L1-like esterase
LAYFRIEGLSKSILVAVALFALCEGGARVFFAQSVYGRFEYGYHPTAGFVETEGGSVRLISAGGRRFRPQQFARRRPPDTFRVVVIGDSVPRGASLATAYPAQIAALLESQGVRAEGINLAVAGYGAHRSQIVLRKILEYEPSLVVLHVNNSNEYEDEREYKRAQDFQGWHPRYWPMKSFIVRRLYEAKTEQLFWRWLPLPIRMQQMKSDADAEVAASLNPEKLRQWDAEVRRRTADSVALARSRGVPVLLVTQAVCDLAAGPRARLDDQGLDQLAEELRGAGVFHVSMRRAFEPLPYAALYADGSHLKPEGHAALARAIVETLRQHGALPALAPRGT